MAASGTTFLVYALLAVPLVAVASWSVYRHSAPLLFDLVDADEMAVAGIHRMITAAHVLLGAAAGVYLAPAVADVHQRPVGALLSALAGLLALLAALHLGLLALYFWAKTRRNERAFPPPPWRPPAPPTSWSNGSVLIPGAAPPTVPMPPPVFVAPRAGTPVGARVDSPVWSYPPPTGPRLAAPTAPPYPPWWCTPVPENYDAWAPPRR